MLLYSPEGYHCVAIAVAPQSVGSSREPRYCVYGKGAMAAMLRVIGLTTIRRLCSRYDGMIQLINRRLSSVIDGARLPRRRVCLRCSSF